MTLIPVSDMIVFALVFVTYHWYITQKVYDSMINISCLCTADKMLLISRSALLISVTLFIDKWLYNLYKLVMMG